MPSLNGSVTSPIQIPSSLSLSLISGVIVIVFPITEADAPTCTVTVRALPEGYPDTPLFRDQATLTIDIDDTFKAELILDDPPNSVEVDTGDIGVAWNELVRCCSPAVSFKPIYWIPHPKIISVSLNVHRINTDLYINHPVIYSYIHL